MTIFRQAQSSTKTRCTSFSENLGFYTNTPILHQSVLKSVQRQKNRIILISHRPWEVIASQGLLYFLIVFTRLVANYTNLRFPNIMKLIAEEGEDWVWAIFYQRYTLSLLRNGRIKTCRLHRIELHKALGQCSDLRSSYEQRLDVRRPWKIQGRGFLAGT